MQTKQHRKAERQVSMHVSCCFKFQFAFVQDLIQILCINHPTLPSSHSLIFQHFFTLNCNWNNNNPPPKKNAESIIEHVLTFLKRQKCHLMAIPWTEVQKRDVSASISLLHAAHDMSELTTSEMLFWWRLARLASKRCRQAGFMCEDEDLEVKRRWKCEVSSSWS